MYKAKEAAIKALEIDNKLAEAYAELAYAKMLQDWDFAGAEKGFVRALELNPNYSGAHSRYARLLTWLKRFYEAEVEFQKARELDPLSVGIWIEFGRCYYWARDFDGAISEYHKILELYPGSESAHAQLSLAYSQMGLHKEAIEEFLKVKDKNAWYWFYQGYIFGNAGEIEKAQEVLDYYLELSRTEFVWPAIFVFIYAGMGETDKAIEWLEKTYEQREAWLDVIQVEPMYDNLRSDPRFQELVDRMNFPGY
jgi:tetratricopeptide (TPR) repeat protein